MAGYYIHKRVAAYGSRLKLHAPICIYGARTRPHASWAYAFVIARLCTLVSDASIILKSRSRNGEVGSGNYDRGCTISVWLSEFMFHLPYCLLFFFCEFSDAYSGAICWFDWKAFQCNVSHLEKYFSGCDVFMIGVVFPLMKVRKINLITCIRTIVLNLYWL